MRRSVTQHERTIELWPGHGDLSCISIYPCYFFTLDMRLSQWHTSLIPFSFLSIPSRKMRVYRFAPRADFYIIMISLLACRSKTYFCSEAYPASKHRPSVGYVGCLSETFSRSAQCSPVSQRPSQFWDTPQLPTSKRRATNDTWSAFAAGPRRINFSEPASNRFPPQLPPSLPVTKA